MSRRTWARNALVAPVAAFARAAPSPVALARSLRVSFSTLDVVAPSEAVVGDPVTLRVQAWDDYERLVRGFEGAVALETTDPRATLPRETRFRASEGGVHRVEVTFETPGLQYVRAEVDGVTAAAPVAVSREEPTLRTYWGDIHLHSQFSDGVGSMERGFAFGREVMGLDVVAYTDHDTMGFFIPPDLQRWLMRRRNLPKIRERVEAAHRPDEFVTLFGYEWTKQPHAGGHVNCYFDGTDAPFVDSRSPDSNTYEALWARLREWRAAKAPRRAAKAADDAEVPPEEATDVVTIPHHPAEAMYPFDFAATEVDDDLAPLVETYSQWGSSERPGEAGNRKPIGGIGQGEVGERGHYVADALAMGNRMGLVAGSDYHGPRPGRSPIHAPPHVPPLSEVRRDGLGWGTVWRLMAEDSYAGGLTAFRAPALTRAAVFDALRTRRVYGTTQPNRIRTAFTLEGRRLSDPDHEVSVDPRGEREVRLRVAGDAPLECVEVVKNTETWRTVDPGDGPAGYEDWVAEATLVDGAPLAGMQYDGERGTDADAYHLRVVQRDGGMAWAGPLWAVPE
ncbi:hypothetical protein [Haloglomus litoreum]|uniref:hypothetical protein n=1 Tax=Haloglomus litoreum TaxID=3034026 RepID=UPI0023E78F5F|nr:hypothetical protein [Haloglomus sp. DT116]